MNARNRCNRSRDVRTNEKHQQFEGYLGWTIQLKNTQTEDIYLSAYLMTTRWARSVTQIKETRDNCLITALHAVFEHFSSTTGISSTVTVRYLCVSEVRANLKWTVDNL